MASGWTLRGLNPGMGRRFCLFENHPDNPYGPSSLIFIGYLLVSWVQISRGVKLTTHPPAIADIENEWSCVSVPPVPSCCAQTALGFTVSVRDSFLQPLMHFF